MLSIGSSFISLIIFAGSKLMAKPFELIFLKNFFNIIAFSEPVSIAKKLLVLTETFPM